MHNSVIQLPIGTHLLFFLFYLFIIYFTLLPNFPLKMDSFELQLLINAFVFVERNSLLAFIVVENNKKLRSLVTLVLLS